MIICLYHGSTNEEVNKNQTGNITTKVKELYLNEKVVESFYSPIINRRLRGSEYKRDLLEDIITSNYNLEHKFYILLTTLVNGLERERIINKIKNIDKQNKVQFTLTLLENDNLELVSESLLIDDYEQVIYVGHGIKGSDNLEYTKLQDKINSINEVEGRFKDSISKKYFICLIEGENSIENIEQELDIDRSLCIKPLMITNGFHAKKNIENQIVPFLKDKGYKVDYNSRPLSKNNGIIDIYLKLLKTVWEKCD